MQKMNAHKMNALQVFRLLRWLVGGVGAAVSSVYVDFVVEDLIPSANDQEATCCGQYRDVKSNQSLHAINFSHFVDVCKSRPF
jgi:hypothetical protein